MLVRCPRCRAENQVSDYDPQQRAVRYLCSGCDCIVSLDLLLDQVPSSSAPLSFARVERPRTILVADDDAATRAVAAEILREAGYDVLEAGDGTAALDSFERGHPDLLLVELLMPGVNGVDIVRTVRGGGRARSTPVLVMGSVFKPDVVALLESLGAAGFIDKDGLVDTLVFRVAQALGEHDGTSSTAL